jgi:hypothetical protein
MEEGASTSGFVTHLGASLPGEVLAVVQERGESLCLPGGGFEALREVYGATETILG